MANQRRGAPQIRAGPTDAMILIGCSKLPGFHWDLVAFSQNDPLLFWAFNEKVLTPSSVKSWNWPELLIRRHFLAEKRGLLI